MSGLRLVNRVQARMMELVDMRGLKPRPFWVLVQVQVRVYISQPRWRILKYMPLSRLFFRFNALFYSTPWNIKVLFLFLFLGSATSTLYSGEAFLFWADLELDSTAPVHYFIAFTGSFNLGTLLTQASHLFFLYLSLGILLIFLVSVS